MNQSKFSLADLLSGIAALIFGSFCFVSFNFLYLGETKSSVIWTLVFVILLGGIAFIVKLLKKVSGNFRVYIIWEGILLLLFVVVAFIAISPFSHYFAVSEQKEEIQTKITDNIEQAEKMFGEYEVYSKNRENNYHGDLKSVVIGKVVSPSEYDRYGFMNNIDDSTQIKNKIFTLHANLFPSNFIEMKRVDSTWLAEARNAMDNWNPIGAIKIVTIVSEVKSNTEKWLSKLKEFSAFRATGEEAQGFDYSFTFAVVTSKFTILGKPTILSILIEIGLCLIMLFSYFISERDPRYPGLKIIFGKGKSEENEW